MLKGHTSNIPLPNIFQTLSLNQQGGVLTVKFDKQERRLGIQPNGISLVADRAYESKVLRQILIDLRLLSESECNNVFSTSGKDTPPGDLLLSRHLITPEQVQTAIREQFMELIYQIFSWEDASYQFELRDLTPDQQIFTDPDIQRYLTFPINSVLMDVARREDEWMRINETIPYRCQIYEVQDLPPGSALPSLDASPERVERILELLRGQVTIPDLLEQSGLPAFVVFSTLRSLVAEGIAQPMSLADKKSLAERLRQQFQMPRMAQVYDSVLEEDPDDTEIRKKLLIFLERKKASPAEFLPHLRKLAQEACDRDDRLVAQQYLDRILESDAQDLLALEATIGLELTDPSNKDPRRSLQAYLGVVRAQRQFERGAEFFAELAETALDPARVLHESAQLLLMSGKPQEAVERYEQAAEAYLSTQRVRPIGKIVEKLEALDEKVAARWRKHLPSSDHASPRTRRRRVRKLGTLLVAGLTITCVAFGIYEWDARASYAEALGKARTAAIQGDFGSARKLLFDCKDQHPYSLVVRSAEADLANLPRPRTSSEGDTTRDTGTEVVAHEVPDPNTPTDFDASNYVTQGTLLKNRGDYVGALAHYRSIDADRLPVRISGQIENECKALETYLDTALSLYESALAAERAGDVEEASLAFQRVLSEYPYSAAATEVRLPLHLEVVPADSEVRLEGKVVPGPPYRLRILPREHALVIIERPGFVGDQVLLDPSRSPRARIQLQKQVEWTRTLSAPIEATPVVNGQRVFVAARSGQVAAHDLATGEPLWRSPLDGIGDVLGALHVIGEDLVFTGTDLAVYRIRRTDGSRVYRLPFPRSAGLARKPMTKPDSSGRSFLVTNRGRILAFDLNNSKLLWEYSLGGGGDLVLSQRHGNVFAATREGKVVCLRATNGEERWSRNFRAPITAGPTIAHNSIVLADGERRVASLRMESGKEHWSHPMGEEVSSLLIGGDQLIYLVQGGLGVLQAETGQLEWSSSELANRPLGTALDSDNAYVGCPSGELLAFDRRTGTLRWTHRIAGELSCPPVVKNGHLILSGMDNTLSVLRVGE